MIIAARSVLADCHDSVAELTDDLSGSVWRRRWASSVSLLRAVGHVLSKVDCEASPRLKSIVDAEWPTFKKDPLFAEFIENERNSILKTYTSRTSQSVTIKLGVMGSGVAPESYHTYKIEGGHFDGADPRVVARLALQWWEDKLNFLEQRAGSTS